METKPLDCIIWLIDGQGKEYKSASIAQAKSLVQTIKKPIWFHIAWDHPDARDLLKTFQLQPKLITAFLAQETRPNYSEQNEQSLIILRAVNCNQESHPEHMISARILLLQDTIITARSSKWLLKSARSVRDDVVTNGGFTYPAKLALAILNTITDILRETVDELEMSTASLEQLSLASRLQAKVQHVENSRAIAKMQQDAAALKRFLVPQRKALEDFLQSSRITADQESSEDLHRNINRTVRYIEDLSLVQERITFILQTFKSQSDDLQNRRLYILSIMTAIFLPLSFITGLFGMNVAGLPGTENVSSFMNLMIAMCLSTASMIIAMRLLRWL